MEHDLVADSPAGAPTFDEAVRDAVACLGEQLQEFQQLYERVPGTAYADPEWTQIEAVARDLEDMVSRGEDAYEAAGLDGKAWYSVMEQLRKVAGRLSDAVTLMRAVETRWQIQQSRARP